MDAEEIAREFDAATELLESTTMSRLAYLGPDGLPRVIPIAFFWTGTEIVLATATNSPKVRALRERPEVAFVADTGDTPGSARSLSVRGTAHVTIVDGVAEEYLAAAYRTYPAEQAREFEKNVRQMYAQQARIALEPTWARYYDFGAGRVPAFLTELAQQQ